MASAAGTQGGDRRVGRDGPGRSSVARFGIRRRKRGSLKDISGHGRTVAFPGGRAVALCGGAWAVVGERGWGRVGCPGPAVREPPRRSRPARRPGGRGAGSSPELRRPVVLPTSPAARVGSEGVRRRPGRPPRSPRFRGGAARGHGFGRRRSRRRAPRGPHQTTRLPRRARQTGRRVRARAVSERGARAVPWKPAAEEDGGGNDSTCLVIGWTPSSPARDDARHRLAAAFGAAYTARIGDDRSIPNVQ